MASKAQTPQERTQFLFDYGLDMRGRRMIVGIPYMEHNTDNNVSFPLASNFHVGLHALEYFYEPESQKKVKDVIDIEFQSYGGDIYTSLGIYDRLVACTVKTRMHVFGPCQSGGSIILQAADERLLSPTSRLMLHYGSLSDEGDRRPKRRKEITREEDEITDILVKIYLSRANKEFLNEDMLRNEILEVDTYINSNRCIQLGLADKIIDITQNKEEGDDLQD